MDIVEIEAFLSCLPMERVALSIVDEGGRNGGRDGEAEKRRNARNRILGGLGGPCSSSTTPMSIADIYNKKIQMESKARKERFMVQKCAGGCQ